MSVPVSALFESVLDIETCPDTFLSPGPVPPFFFLLRAALVTEQQQQQQHDLTIIHATSVPPHVTQM